MESKHLSLRKHAKRRAQQRCGLAFNKTDRRNILSIIQCQSSEFGKVLASKKQTNSKTEILLSYKDNKYFLIYDKNRKEVITFLKPEWFKK